MSARARRIAVAWLGVTVMGCGVAEPIRDLFRSESAYEEYLATLRGSGLDRLALGQDWVSAGEQALANPMSARLPFRETGYFPPHTPAAVAYRLALRRGRRLVVEISFDTARPAQLFVDLFQERGPDPPQRVASLPADAATLSYEVRRDGNYLLRVQPELLRGGRWSVTERTQASIGFPVPGLGIQAVKSGFGVERDAGRRRHHGIDIFAPRGTPAVAVTGGTARSSTNELGGNVIWLYDSRGGRTYYYAHLDRWKVEGNAPVEAGDTVGFIGTTGNARTTPPHLHFGIYDGGPVDPLPFVAPDDPAPPPVAAPLERLDGWVRVVLPSATLRSGPHRDADTLRRLPLGSVARVRGASQGALRISLPDDSGGYLELDAVTGAGRALGSAQLDSGSVLRESPAADAPAVLVLASRSAAEVLGRFEDFALVRLDDSRLGWLETGSLDLGTLFRAPARAARRGPASRVPRAPRGRPGF